MCTQCLQLPTEASASNVIYILLRTMFLLEILGQLLCICGTERSVGPT